MKSAILLTLLLPCCFAVVCAVYFFSFCNNHVMYVDDSQPCVQRREERTLRCWNLRVYTTYCIDNTGCLFTVIDINIITTIIPQSLLSTIPLSQISPTHAAATAKTFIQRVNECSREYNSTKHRKINVSVCVSLLLVLQQQ